MLYSKSTRLGYVLTSIHQIYRCILQSIIDTVNHDGVEHAGYLAFLLMLGILPFLFFMMALASFFGAEHMYDYLVMCINSRQADNLLGALKPRINEIIFSPPRTLLTFTILSAVWTASSIFEAMRTILNRANRIINTPSYLRRRLISIFEFMTIIITTSFVIILLRLASILRKIIQGNFVCSIKTLQTVDYFLYKSTVLGYTCFLLLFSYLVLPNKRMSLSYNVPGIIIVIASWVSFTKIFNYYIATFSQLSVIYGGIVGIIISLLYFHFCSVIFIFGAEFNYNFYLEKKKSTNL